MTVQTSTHHRVPARPGEAPPSISLETLEAVQQVLLQALGGLRERLSDRSARAAGEIEYASWLQRRH